ncbi:MAG: ribonuclease III [Acidobacteriota bacterium]|nr:ribonuclease III [Acidobacteriota bacterium]MDE3044196.1 ribonuclease III [Acidobacteriota bacterium]
MSLSVSPLVDLAARVGLSPTSALLTTAMTHSSYAAEHGVTSNERLEFLGDAVVDLAIADLIVRDFPELDEGSGSLVRSKVVNESSLAEAARVLALGAVVRVGKGVQKENGRERPSLLADAFEALVAAIYLECGYELARDFVQRALRADVEAALTEPGAVDPKTRLRQWSEARGRGTPRYEVTADGPSHAVTFEARVFLVDEQWAVGHGRSKKAAEADAARRAWERRDA